MEVFAAEALELATVVLIDAVVARADGTRSCSVATSRRPSCSASGTPTGEIDALLDELRRREFVLAEPGGGEETFASGTP